MSCQGCKNEVDDPFDLKYVIKIDGNHLFICNECFVKEQENLEKEKEKILKEFENYKLLEEIKKQNGTCNFKWQIEDFYHELHK